MVRAGEGSGAQASQVELAAEHELERVEVAAGFGEFQPLEQGDNDEALRRNRRIELKLTDR